MEETIQISQATWRVMRLLYQVSLFLKPHQHLNGLFRDCYIKTKGTISMWYVGLFMVRIISESLNAFSLNNFLGLRATKFRKTKRNVSLLLPKPYTHSPPFHSQCFSFFGALPFSYIKCVSRLRTISFILHTFFTGFSVFLQF